LQEMHPLSKVKQVSIKPQINNAQNNAIPLQPLMTISSSK